MGQKKEHSNLIKEHLKKRGFTQTWLAKELVPEKIISKYPSEKEEVTQS